MGASPGVGGTTDDVSQDCTVLLTLPLAKARGFLLRRGALHTESYSHSSGVTVPQALRYVGTFSNLL